MTKIVLTADRTLMCDYNNIPLGSFFSCIPADHWASQTVFKIISGNPPHRNGAAIFAPYAIRKIEGGLILKYGRDDVVVAHPDHLDKFITNDTKVVGITVMDPLGLGPVSMSFTYGGMFTSYTKHMFIKLMDSIRSKHKDHKFKLIVGGPGAWQFEYKPEIAEKYHIDHIVSGEIDHIVGDLFDKIIQGSMPFRIEEKSFAPLEHIPLIQGAVMEGMVETMRGCGRGCQFCEVTLRKLRYMDHDFIKKEVAINVKEGKTDIHAHSDDIFVYKLEDYKDMMPNSDAIRDLFKAIMSVPGVTHTNPTHGTLAAALADPLLVKDITKIVRGGPDQWIGVQTGLETGSTRLVEKIMPRKLRPYRPEEWREVVMGGLKVFNDNYWYPAMTAITGLPGETPEDVWDTVTLLDQMEKLPNNHFIVAPLTFVPIGALKNKEFFNLDEMIDEARFNFMYRCWKHIVMEIDSNLGALHKAPPAVRAVMGIVAKVGSRFIMKKMENYSKEKGFKIKYPQADPIPIRV